MGSMYLHTVETGLLGPERSLDVAIDQFFDLLRFQGPGNSGDIGLADGGRSYGPGRLQGVGYLPAGVIYLRDYFCRTGPVHGGGKVL